MPLRAFEVRADDGPSELRQFEGVHMVDIGSAQDVGEGLMRWLRNKDSPEAAQARRHNLQLVEKYSRSSQSAVLARILDQVLPPRSS